MHQELSNVAGTFVQLQDKPLFICFTHSEVQEDPQSAEDRPAGFKLIHMSADRNGAAVPGSTRNLRQCSTRCFSWLHCCISVFPDGSCHSRASKGAASDSVTAVLVVTP